MTTKQDVVETVRVILAVSGANRYDGAKALGITPQSFSQKLYRGSFSASELLTLIEYLGGKATVKGDTWTLDL